MPALAINSTYYRASFLWLQIDCSPTDCFLVANGKNATVLTSPRYILPQQMLHKTADGCKTAVPGHSGVSTSRFNMIQKCEHGVGLDIVDGKVGHGFALLICQE
jgi:hypothetical protein